MKTSFLLIIPLILALSGASGDVTLPQLISDNMLLQRDKAFVWGKADPGENVTVNLGQLIASTITGSDGRWRVQLNGLRPGVLGDMTIIGKNQRTIKNVAVGDVWVCSGQSNMQMSLKGRSHPSGGVLNFEQEIAAANYPDIRMFTVSRKASETPVEDIEGKWQVCTPEVVPQWSAVAYFFGRKLNEDLGLPIGLIQASCGGTWIQTWMPTETIQGDPEFKTFYDQRQTDLANMAELKATYQNVDLPAWQTKADEAKTLGQRIPPKPQPPIGPNEGPSVSALYNKMVYGATFYGIKGAIWYQGEANAGDADRYRHMLPALITSWRKAWNQPDFDFYIVQLANWGILTPNPVSFSAFANLREAQRLTAETLPHCGLVVSIDIGEEKNIHPANKQEVGRRLALAAEAQTYSKKIVYSGPALAKAEFEGNTVKIRFKPGTAAGLKTLDGAPVKSFALAGQNKKFVWADAQIKIQPNDEPILVLSAKGVEKAAMVCYAWADNPEVNLVNEAGLPAVPFRAGTW